MSGKKSENDKYVSFSFDMENIGDESCRHYRGPVEKEKNCELPLPYELYRKLKFLNGGHPVKIGVEIRIYPKNDTELDN